MHSELQLDVWFLTAFNPSNGGKKKRTPPSLFPFRPQREDAGTQRQESFTLPCAIGELGVGGWPAAATPNQERGRGGATAPPAGPGACSGWPAGLDCLADITSLPNVISTLGPRHQLYEVVRPVFFKSGLVLSGIFSNRRKADFRVFYFPFFDASAVNFQRGNFWGLDRHKLGC